MERDNLSGQGCAEEHAMPMDAANSLMQRDRNLAIGFLRGERIGSPRGCCTSTARNWSPGSFAPHFH